MDRSLKKHLVAALLVLCASVVLRLARYQLPEAPTAVFVPWASQVIFGLYFTILTLTIQGLTAHVLHPRPHSGRQIILLLILSGICADLVLVNVSEVKESVGASYGPFVAWDITTFFIWLRVTELCRPGARREFASSWTVFVAPLFGLGREILKLPYESTNAWLAYLDLLFGHLLTSVLWLLLPFVDRLSLVTGRRDSVERTLLQVIFVGCAYWVVSAVENGIGLVWPPFYPGLYKWLVDNHIPIAFLNCFQLVLAVAIALWVRWWNLFGLGASLGIAKSEPPHRPSR